MRVILCVFLSWTVSVLSCANRENVVDAMTPVEVYQIIHLINTTTNITIKVDVLRNSVELPSGTICEYHSGSCYDSKSSLNYTWETSHDFLAANHTCSNLTYFYIDANDLNYTYSILTLRKDPLVMYLVVEGSKFVYSLQLTKESILCGKKVWRTDQEDLVVTIGEDNFIESVSKARSHVLPTLAGVTVYNVDRKDDLYSMVLKCDDQTASSFASQMELDQYKHEVVQLKASVITLQTAVQRMQKQLFEFENENSELKKYLNMLQDGMQAPEYYSEAIEMVDTAQASPQKEAMETLPHTFLNTFDGFKNCPNFILFPFENFFCILVAILYVSFSVMNTITNYFSLRTLRNKKQKCFVFYALTQGLTNLYISRCLSLTKKKIDKWLLDLE